MYRKEGFVLVRGTGENLQEGTIKLKPAGCLGIVQQDSFTKSSSVRNIQVFLECKIFETLDSEADCLSEILSFNNLSVSVGKSLRFSVPHQSFL